METKEIICQLDQEALDLFAVKGRETENPDPINANAAPVRRVLQIVHDFSHKPISDLHILDLACGEGVYAIETALRGARVTAIDGRTERMNKGKEVAERLRMENLHFEQKDIREVSVETHGQFDVIYMLGILYHLDVPDVFHTLENVCAMTRGYAIIDTHISLTGREEATHKRVTYRGSKYREHSENDTEELRRSRLLASLDNAQSFWFTKQSLIGLLGDIGFTSVFECHNPVDPVKPNDRLTLVALKGRRVNIAAYPWINDKTDKEIEDLLLINTKKGPSESSSVEKVKGIINRVLNRLGYEIRRV